MEGHTVEVGHNLIDRDWGGPLSYDQTSWPGYRVGIAYPEKRSVRRDWMRTF